MKTEEDTTNSTPTQTQPVFSDGTQTEAQKRLQELQIAILRLDQWEQAEIRFSVDKIHQMLRKYHSSAALAVLQVSLEIAVQKGQ